jgi:AmmeMemoRadiSam system protein B
MVRETAVAGQFYENDFDYLTKQIEKCYTSKKGPGDLPINRSDSALTGVIVPHAGYDYSGACATWAYKEIAESSFPDVFLLLGPNHFGFGSGLSIEDWKTPFGIVKTDKDFIIGLKENTSLKIAEQNHLTEHSLEVQLPFLQFSNKDHMKDIRIAPIVLGRDFDYKKLAKQLHDFLKKQRNKVVFIMSTDFTHYGSHYGYVPFTSDIPERITQLDKGAIKKIMKYDSQGFKEYINKTGITMCGYMGVLVFLELMQYREKKPSSHLLMHYMSGDLTGDFSNSVSYVSMVFKQKK